LGNVRSVVRDDGTIVKQFDYAPFGAVLNSTDINRTKFIGKEKDKESNYADHGVRKYDDEIGRFTSIKFFFLFLISFLKLLLLFINLEFNYEI